MKMQLFIIFVFSSVVVLGEQSLKPNTLYRDGKQIRGSLIKPKPMSPSTVIQSRIPTLLSKGIIKHNIRGRDEIKKYVPLNSLTFQTSVNNRNKPTQGDLHNSSFLQQMISKSKLAGVKQSLQNNKKKQIINRPKHSRNSNKTEIFSDKRTSNFVNSQEENLKSHSNLYYSGILPRPSSTSTEFDTTDLKLASVLSPLESKASEGDIIWLLTTKKYGDTSSTPRQLSIYKNAPQIVETMTTNEEFTESSTVTFTKEESEDLMITTSNQPETQKPSDPIFTTEDLILTSDQTTTENSSPNENDNITDLPEQSTFRLIVELPPNNNNVVKPIVRPPLLTSFKKSNNENDIITESTLYDDYGYDDDYRTGMNTPTTESEVKNVDEVVPIYNVTQRHSTVTMIPFTINPNNTSTLKYDLNQTIQTDSKNNLDEEKYVLINVWNYANGQLKLAGVRRVPVKLFGGNTPPNGATVTAEDVPAEVMEQLTPLTVSVNSRPSQNSDQQLIHSEDHIKIPGIANIEIQNNIAQSFSYLDPHSNKYNGNVPDKINIPVDQTRYSDAVSILQTQIPSHTTLMNQQIDNKFLTDDHSQLSTTELPSGEHPIFIEKPAEDIKITYPEPYLGFLDKDPDLDIPAGNLFDYLVSDYSNVQPTEKITAPPETVKVEDSNVVENARPLIFDPFLESSSFIDDTNPNFNLFTHPLSPTNKYVNSPVTITPPKYINTNRMTTPFSTTDYEINSENDQNHNKLSAASPDHQTNIYDKTSHVNNNQENIFNYLDPFTKSPIKQEHLNVENIHNLLNIKSISNKESHVQINDQISHTGPDLTNLFANKDKNYFGGVGNPGLDGIPISFDEQFTYMSSQATTKKPDLSSILSGVGNNQLQGFPVGIGGNIPYGQQDGFASVLNHNPLKITNNRFGNDQIQGLTAVMGVNHPIGQQDGFASFLNHNPLKFTNNRFSNDQLQGLTVGMGDNHPIGQQDGFASVLNHNPSNFPNNQEPFKETSILNAYTATHAPINKYPLSNVFSVENPVWYELERLQNQNNLFGATDLNNPQIASIIRTLAIQSILATQPEIIGIKNYKRPIYKQRPNLTNIGTRFTLPGLVQSYTSDNIPYIPNQTVGRTNNPNEATLSIQNIDISKLNEELESNFDSSFLFENETSEIHGTTSIKPTTIYTEVTDSGLSILQQLIDAENLPPKYEELLLNEYFFGSENKDIFTDTEQISNKINVSNEVKVLNTNLNQHINIKNDPQIIDPFNPLDVIESLNVDLLLSDTLSSSSVVSLDPEILSVQSNPIAPVRSASSSTVNNCLNNNACAFALAAALAIGATSALAVPFVAPVVFGRKRRQFEDEIPSDVISILNFISQDDINKISRDMSSLVKKNNKIDEQIIKPLLKETYDSMLPKNKLKISHSISLS